MKTLAPSTDRSSCLVTLVAPGGKTIRSGPLGSGVVPTSAVGAKVGVAVASGTGEGVGSSEGGGSRVGRAVGVSGAGVGVGDAVAVGVAVGAMAVAGLVTAISTQKVPSPCPPRPKFLPA